MPRKGTTAETTTLVEPTPLGASWPARTWTPAERVTAGMMNTIRDQLNELHSGLSQAESTTDIIIHKTYPSLVLKWTGDTTFGRLFNPTPAQVNLTCNMGYDGANWMRDDPAHAGMVLQVTADNGVVVFSAPAGANPAGMTMLMTLRSDGMSLGVPLKNPGVSNSLGDLTCGPTNFTAGVTCTAGQSSFAGHVLVTAGSGTSYATSPLELQMAASPRIAFHWPGVVAAQLGMDSAGTITAWDNPGTGYAAFRAGGIYSTGILQGIQQPRIVLSGAGGIQIDCNTMDMLAIDYCNVGTTFYNPLNPRDGLGIIIRLKDAGGAVPLAWDGHFITGCPTAIPTATVAPSKLMSMAFRYAAAWDRWYMMACSVEP